MAALTSARLKKVRFRSAATIQRSAISTAVSTLALSRGRRTRVGRIVVAVVRGEIQVRRMEIGLVPIGMEHGGLVVVGDQAAAPRQILEGADVAPDPGWEIGRAGGLGVGVVARAEHGDEQGHRRAGAGLRIGEPERLAGVVQEQLFTGPVLLAEADVQSSGPRTVVDAVLAVLEASGVPGLVLLPEELEGHPGVLEFLVDRGPVRERPVSGLGARPAIQLAGEHPVIEVGWERPRHAGGSRAGETLGDRAPGNPAALGDLAIAAAAVPLQAKDLSNRAHG